MMDDHSLLEAVNEFKDNLALAETADTIRRQLAFQEQMVGNVAAQEPGRFEFTLDPYVDCVSESMGVREGHFTANLRQQGQFIEDQ